MQLLTDKQVEAIKLITETELTYGEIANKMKIHRNTLLQWREKEEFKAEIDKYIQLRVKVLEDRIKLESENLVNKALKLIDKAESEPVRADLIKYLIDRSLGKASTKIDMSIEPKIDEQKDKEDFLKMLEEEKAETIEADDYSVEDVEDVEDEN